MALHPDELRRYAYFSSLSDSALQYLSDRINPISVPAGEVIIKEGTVGGSFFFIKEGKVEVTKRGSDGNEAVISVVEGGQGIGEMALLTGSVRACSVRALTPLELFELRKDDFESVVMCATEFREELSKKAVGYTQFNKLKTLQPFELLPPEKVYAVMEKMTERTYPAGADIIAQGEKGDVYYIIKSGRVDVLKKKKGSDEVAKVAELADGDAFGEEALIREDPRNATCRAAVETTVLVLEKKDFNNIVKAAFLENIFPEEIELESYMQDYVILDVRIPPEYAE